MTDGRGMDGGLGGCLGALDAAIADASALGLDVSEAVAVRGEAEARLGLSPDVYVLGLVGGTGVGKSSLLNALAGRQLTEVGVRRPTTDRPVAWVEPSVAAVAGPVLERLGVEAGRLGTTGSDGGAGRSLGPVVLLDLPDVDSVAATHRATVEALLPRLDAVAWVTDPEKYADALLHDEFLRSWLPRLGRQVLVLNKVDRVPAGRLEEVRRDVARTLQRDGGSGGSVPVLATSARAGGPGVEGLARWLRSEADAKAVIASRLGRAAKAAVERLGAEAGVAAADVAEAGVPRAGVAVARPVELLDRAARSRALDAASEAALRLVDLPGVRSRAVAATRARARRVGTGPVGWVTSLVYRTSGRQRRVADPTDYLRRWRERGTIARPIEPLEVAAAAAIASAPPALRSSLAADTEPARLTTILAAAVDRAIASTAPLRPPTSLAWRLIGMLQSANAVLLVFSVAWLVLWILLRPAVGTLDLPLVGPVPQPIALLAIALALGFLLARVLALHAGLVGGRWARRVADAIRESVEREVARDAFGALDAIDAARGRLAEDVRRVHAGCG